MVTSPLRAYRVSRCIVTVLARSILRQAEHALAEDVLEDLGGARADAARAREQLVEFPLPVVGRPRRALGDLRVGADDLGGRERELLVELAPEELGRRALGPGLTAAQDFGEAAIGAHLQRLLPDPERRRLLADERVAAAAALAHEPHE